MLIFLSHDEITNNQLLTVKWNHLDQIIASMMNIKYSERPNCTHILSTCDQWSIIFNEKEYFGLSHIDISMIKSNEFFKRYFITRLNNLEENKKLLAITGE